MIPALVPQPRPETPEGREDYLRVYMETQFKDFADSIKYAVENHTILTISQKGFANDYDQPEMLLLGMMVKYAGLFGVELYIVGKNKFIYRQSPEAVCNNSPEPVAC